VSHGAIIRNTLKGLIPELDTKELLKNTSLTIITKLDDQWNCELYNCTRHLNG
jgi:2,3-bisphosphoglycerate-dependent phosphoglycerate mutase